MPGRTDIPNKVIENLRRFNRKERFYLIGAALDNPKFKLGTQFWERLRKCLGLQEEMPDNAFVAMDYHLDSVYASLYLASKGWDVDRARGEKFRRPKEIIKGTQEDIDLLIAYRKDNECHMLFLEAKGVTGFNNKQLCSKAKRLKEMFEERWEGVNPHFALISPRPSRRLKTECWPEWMHPKGKIHRVELDWPHDLVRTSRCDAYGEPDKEGDFWTVLPKRHAKNSKRSVEIEDKT